MFLHLMPHEADAIDPGPDAASHEPAESEDSPLVIRFAVAKAPVTIFVTDSQHGDVRDAAGLFVVKRPCARTTGGSLDVHVVADRSTGAWKV